MVGTLKRYWYVIAIALFLRVWGITFGLYHPDEPLVVNQALAFGSGKLIPGVYYYPPLFHYLLFLLYGFFFLLGWIFGQFRDFNNFVSLVLLEPNIFYIIGRVATAFIGTATIFPVYVISKKLCSEKSAVMSSVFMAFMYLHIRNSHFCTTDVPMTFLLTLTYVFIINIVQKNNRKDYLYAGILAGLSMATKYNAAILILCIGAAAAANFSIREERRKNIDTIKNLILSYIYGLAVFLVFCSYVVLDLPGFIDAWNVLARLGGAMDISTWYRFSVDLFHGIGLPLEFLGILGFGWLIFKKEKKGLVVVLFPVLYLIGIRKVGQPFARYSLPLLPFFAVSAGIILDILLSRIKAKLLVKKVIMYSVVISVILIPCSKAIYADYLLSKPDLRDLSFEWIRKNVPTGKGIVIDNSQYAPHLKPTKEQLKEKMAFLSDRVKGSGIKRKRLELLMALKQYPAHTYRVYYFGEAPAEFIMHTPVVNYDITYLKKNDIDYIITNDISEEQNTKFYKNNRSVLKLVKRFEPFKQKNSEYSKYAYSLLPLDNTLFRFSNNGIGINIYKIENE